jgi:hypothetical protein
MRNDYQYIDADYIYTDPRTGVLRNLSGIADRDALVFAEAAAATKRANELKTRPIRVTRFPQILGCTSSPSLPYSVPYNMLHQQLRQFNFTVNLFQFFVTKQ